MRVTLVILLTLAKGAEADGGWDAPKIGAKGEKACRAGNAAECVKTGQLLVMRYFSWDGGNTDDMDRADRLFHRACELGSVAGCREVGWLWWEARDEARAKPIFEKTCAQGDLASCSYLGDMAQQTDKAAAIRMWEKACPSEPTDLGCATGCDSLGSVYRYGFDGPPRDSKKAVEMYDRACRAGCGNSCDTLGDLLSDGKDVPRELERAARAWERACDMRFSPSCASLSELYRKGSGVVKDEKKAQQLLARACKLSRNQVEACKKR
jgi:TPR repeat protein